MQSDSTKFGIALMALARAHRARLGELLSQHGVYPGQDGVLQLIWQQPGLRQAHLARHLGIEPPTVARMIARMERSGLVERRADPDDGRAMLVFPTQRSRLIEALVRRIHAELDQEVTQVVGEGDAEKLRKLLIRAQDAFTRPAEPDS